MGIDSTRLEGTSGCVALLCAELEYSVATARRFDREHMSVLTLTITCADSRPGAPASAALANARPAGAPAKTAKQTLVVRVRDVNDNAPAFAQLEYVCEVPENADPAAVGVLLEARATDADEGLNAQLSYYLASAAVGCANVTAPTDARPPRPKTTRDGREQRLDTHEQLLLRRLFLVDEHTGAIRLRERLDREARASYSFLVCARDAGEPAPLTGSASVRIDVADVNDVAPSFERAHYVFNVSEGSAAQRTGQVIGRLRVADCDATRSNSLTAVEIDARRVRGFEPEEPAIGDAYETVGKPLARLPFSLTLVSSSPAAAASGAAAEILDDAAAAASRSGEPCRSSEWELVVSGELDREAVARYEFAVVVKDSGSPRALSSSANVSVHVVDVVSAFVTLLYSDICTVN